MHFDPDVWHFDRTEWQNVLVFTTLIAVFGEVFHRHCVFYWFFNGLYLETLTLKVLETLKVSVAQIFSMFPRMLIFTTHVFQ